MRWWLLGFPLFLCWFTVMAADQHSACHDLSLNDQDYSVKELLAIASTCRVPEVADLYYNRAQYHRLLGKYKRFEHSLIHYGDRDYTAYIESYRIYVGLAEAFFSNRLTPDEKGMLNRLNRLYEQSSEIAEMRFRGYDLIADRLERKLRL